MAFQFLHIDAVSRTVPKKAVAKRWALAEVLAEANRDAAACPHIENPQPPRRLYGVPLRIVGEAALRRADEAHDARGRKLRKDASVMLAGVVSYPVALADMDDQKRADYARWEERSLGWLRSRFGDGLGAVVRHTDEAFPHLHFFAVPEVTSGCTLDMEALHPGIAAREAAKRAGKTAKEANRAYCEAMRGLQDDFHAHVSLFHGHLREGPRRRRLSRGAYLSAQREAEKRSEIMSKAEIEREQLKLVAEVGRKAAQRAARLEAELSVARTENAGLAGEVTALRRQMTALKTDSENLRNKIQQAGEIILQLIGVFTLGAGQFRERLRFRDKLLNLPRPDYVNDSAWERMRRFLSSKGGVELTPKRLRGWERE